MMNWIWLGAVVAFGVLEAATAALVSIWFVGGAAVALLASFLGAALWLQTDHCNIQKCRLFFPLKPF